MPTRTYQIPMDKLFSSQTNYGNMDLESQRIKEEEQRRAEMARENLLGIANTPMSLSNIDTFVPAEMVQSDFPIPNAEPYSQLTARQAPPSIVGGMFSPEISRAAEMEYMQRRQAAMQNEALAYAQLSPMQQAQFGFYRGGQQLGDALGGALGGKDPQLQMIGLQQQILSELDPSDPEQQLRVAQKYARTAPDLAMKIAESARKSMSEMALTTQRLREKQGADPFEQLLRTGKYTPASMATYKVSQNVADLREVDSPDKVPQDIQKARLVAQGKGFKEGTKEYNDEIVKQLEKTDKERNIAFGTEAERKSKTMYGKPYADLTPEESGKVDAAVEQSEREKAKAGAPSSGIKEYKDIPKLRADIISTVKPFRDTVNAADNALTNIGLSMNENNFIAFNAARVQLAKALAGGDLSQKEIQASGGDPSILGGVFDLASTAITSTPSIDTQQKIKDTIKAIRKVALQKGRSELETQRKLAKRSNFTDEDFDLASDIPEFRTKPSGEKTDAVPSFDAEKEKRYQEWKAQQKGKTP
jgi:hypothetical protein